MTKLLNPNSWIYWLDQIVRPNRLTQEISLSGLPGSPSTTQSNWIDLIGPTNSYNLVDRLIDSTNSPKPFGLTNPTNRIKPQLNKSIGLNKRGQRTELESKKAFMNRALTSSFHFFPKENSLISLIKHQKKVKTKTKFDRSWFLLHQTLKNL